MPAEPTILRLLCFIVAVRIENVASNAKIRIVGGTSVDINQRPYMLSLHYSHGFACGASILSARWGITALHCLTLDKTRNYHVRAGSNSPYRGGSRHGLTEVHAYNATAFLHWFNSMFYYDIALFKVWPPFRFSRRVKAAQLPKESSRPPRRLSVCGWGYQEFQQNAKVSNTLMGVTVRHVPYKVCVNQTKDYQMLVDKEHHLCYGTPGKDSCSGDSGGPLGSKHTIYGVVSFGQNCGVVSGIYENISYYRGWVKNITNI
ncbi:trypsin delta [Nomia melanderi]|uniref:trypsin delta n=1 Tax=Nomia melanderi TaxID=2448451 RepID=UPI001303FDAE|nr:trypsin 3A1-like [Nomia melanderi]